MEEEEAKEAQSRLLIRRRGRRSASKVEHSVEDLGGDGDLGGAGLVAVEAQPITDDLFPARELALDPSPLIIYPAHLRTRKSSGEMMRKLSVTLSQNVFHLLGTSRRRKPSTAWQKPL